MEDVLIPIFLFFAMAFVLSFQIYFSNKTKSNLQETIRKVLDSGAELSPELIDRLSRQSAPGSTDFRRGVLLIFLGVGISIFGQLIEPDELEVVAIGVLPIVLGLGYLVVWKLNPDKNGT